MKNNFLDKIIWDESDFDQMNWHDNRIYAISFGIEEYELILDIDYILKWIEPEENESMFKFIVAPATLIFKNVYDLEISSSTVNLIIDTVHRENPIKPINAAYIKEQLEYDWTIETTQGRIIFKSVGFIQYLRRKPLQGSQEIGLLERGGISFGRTLLD